jgi:6-phosphogluconolactonase/glucosamine-6-phosphate isomerase/deaminase
MSSILTTDKPKSILKKNFEYMQEPFVAPDTRYFLTKKEFDTAVGKDFIKYANQTLSKGQKFLVGLSHGQSPAGAYQYIFEHYGEIKNPENILYTFINSKLHTQRDLSGVLDATAFIRKLYKAGFITRSQILGSSLERQSLEEYTINFNQTIAKYLTELEKEGLDYVFLASNPAGRVAGIERTSKAFDSKDIAVIVTYKKEKEMTGTPYFISRSRRIAFLATKSDKRRPLAWLYSVNGKPNESPSFLRFIDKVDKRMTVFVDDQALTWPQLEINRETPYGTSTIRIDTANPYKPNAKEKLPVLILIHGFLGLNSFDGLLATIPSHKYIAAAMHYGSIPNDLPPSEYSFHLTKNIEAVVEFFGSNGHPVYIFDHSMGNIYFMMIDRDMDKYPGIKKYLTGRIGANPFFGEEAKHAILGFLDNVILPALSMKQGLAIATMLFSLRRIIPLDTKRGVRKRGINLSEWLISKESSMRDKIWSAAKERILYLMSNMDSLPHLNRIPIEKALNRLPAKVFAIQTHSALEQSELFDKQAGLINSSKRNIPVLILKSERDGVAKYVDRIYKGRNVEVIDVTNYGEKDLFREHLFHMVFPVETTEIIDKFVSQIEAKRVVASN